MNNLKPVKSVKIKSVKISLIEHLRYNLNKFVFITIVWITLATIFDFLSLIMLLGFLTGVLIWEFIIFYRLKPKKKIMVIR